MPRDSIALGRAAYLLIVVLHSGALSADEAALLRAPPPGSVYKEFSRVMKDNNEWRVTDPNATFQGEPNNSPSAFLPNPELPITIDDLDGAVRAEALLDIWGGHPGTSGKQLRFNGNAWIDVPELRRTPTTGQCYTQGVNVVVDVPLSDLFEGENILEGTAGPQTCHNFNWGQWGWYGIIVRIYYDPALRAPPTGSITSPASGAIIGENPAVTISATSSVGVDRVDVVAWYEGYDRDGDGHYLQYHEYYHRAQPETTLPIRGHVGTDTAAPWSVTWNTQRVPDQEPGSVRLLARIRDATGLWYVTPEVTDLTLSRPGVRVELYKPEDVPESFWVRAGQSDTSTFLIPASHDLARATQAWLIHPTWNGRDGFAEPGQDHHTKINAYIYPSSYGANHHYDQNDLSIPPAELVSGVNTVEVYSESSHHGIETLWPGPGLIVRYSSPGAPSAPTGLGATAADAHQIDLDWGDALVPDSVTYSVHRSTTAGFVPAIANRIATGIEASEWRDGGLVESQTVHYAVIATNKYHESSAAARVSKTTPADTAPAAITGVTSVDDTTIVLALSEAVDPIAAEVPAHFAISGGPIARSVLGASYDAGDLTVTLTVEPLTLGTVYTVSMTGVDDLAASPHPSASSFEFVFDPRLVARWAFDDGSGHVALDSSPHHRDAIAYASGWLHDTPDGSSHSLRLNGSGDWIDAGSIDVDGTALTLAIWFQLEELFDGARLFSKAIGTATNDHYWMLCPARIANGEYRLLFRVRTGTTTTSFTATSGNIVPGTWHHAAAVYTGTTMKVFLDGKLAGSRSKSGALAVDPAVLVAIGNQPACAGARPFPGLVDDARIYRGALSDAEVLELYCGSTEAPNPAATPVITESPAGGTFCEGDVVVLTVETASGSSFTYVWRHDGAVVPGASDPTLVLDPAEPADSGSYTVEVSSLCGTDESSAAVVTVNEAALIESPPEGASVCAGDDVTLSVQATGAPPLSYRWRKDGVDVPGATGASLSIADFDSSDAGAYDVVVSNVCSEVTSAPAVLAGGAAPSITQPPSGATICSGAVLTLSVTASGTAPLAYQWTKNGSDVPGATASTYSVAAATVSHGGSYAVRVTNACGSATSTAATVTVNAAPEIVAGPETQDAVEGTPVVLIVTASGSEPLTYRWRRDGTILAGETTASLSIGAVETADAGIYRVEIENSCGSTFSEAVLSVIVPPEIVTPPVDASPCPGDPLMLSVVATGTSPLSYQWKKNNVAIPGATSATLSFSTVGSSHEGSWTVTVTNAAGSVTSSSATVDVLVETSITTQPSAASLCEGDVLALSVAASGSSLTYQWRKNGATISGATSAVLSVADVDASDAGSYDVVVTGDCGTISSAPAAVTVGTGPMILSSPAPITTCAGTLVRLEASASGTAPLSYAWRKNGVPIGGATGSALELASPTASDSGSYDVVVSNACGSAASTAALVTINAPPAIDVPPVSAGVCEGEPLTLSVAASGTGPFTYTWRKDGTEIPGAIAAELAFSAASELNEGSYDVVVSGPCGAVTSAPALLDVGGGPVISKSPESGIVCAGDTITLAVVAGGSGLAYHWRRDGVELAGVVGPSLTLGSVGPGAAGDYDVVVTSNCGEATSAKATVIVTTPVSIATGPEPQAVCAGEDVTLSVSASGPVVAYHWMKNESEIAETAAPELILPAISASDAGLYSVVARGECNEEVSAEVAVSVLEPPLITLAPVALQVCEGEEAVLRVEAAGENLTYQWRKNGIDVTAATQPEISFPAASPEDAGSWDVVVMNACGQAVSTAVELEVLSAPRIDALPASLARCEGETVSVTATVSGSAPLAYQWQREGVDLPGASSPTLVLEDFAPGDAGAYTLRVTGACGAPAATATVEISITDVCGTPFLRGDSNADGGVDISDAITSLNYLFRGGVFPSCVAALDANDDGGVDIADAIYLLGWLFRGGPAPPAPGPGAGCTTDPTPDTLGCESYPCV